jgi:AcrR family transcriptional regulator
MIYAYFGSKDGLFDTVFSTYVSRSREDVDFDATNLRANAGRLFDRFEDNPTSCASPPGTDLSAHAGRALRPSLRPIRRASHYLGDAG